MPLNAAGFSAFPHLREIFLVGKLLDQVPADAGTVKIADQDVQIFYVRGNGISQHHELNHGDHENHPEHVGVPGDLPEFFFD